MRTSKTFSIQFWADLKRESKGLAPLYARINVDQKRLSVSLKRKIPVKSWNSTTKKFTGNSAKAKEFNRYLDLLKSRL